MFQINPQDCILSSTTLHSRSHPLKGTFVNGMGQGYLNKSIFRVNNNKEIIIIPGKNSPNFLNISQFSEFKSNHHQIEYFSAVTINKTTAAELYG